MAFAKTIYETDLFLPGGETPLVGVVRSSASALLLTVNGTANAPAEGVTANTQIPIRVSGTRKYGITARHIVLVRTVTEAGVTATIYRRVVVFSLDLFNTWLSTLGATVNYEGQTDWLIAGGSQERYHLTFAA